MATARETIDHSTLQQLVEAGAVRGADVIGQAGGWGVIIKYGMIERSLAARRGAIRIFARLETLVNYLRNIGILQFNVNASGYNPVSNRPGRPDASRRLKQAFTAAEHDTWFREQVIIGVAEADNPTTRMISNVEVAEISRQRRAGWAASAK